MIDRLLAKMACRTGAFQPLCPECYAKPTLIDVVCPKCKSRHETDWTSERSVSVKKCTCGHSIRLFSLTGNRIPEMSCRNCGALMERHHVFGDKYRIVLLGAPSAGKTAFLHTAIQEKRLRGVLRFPDSERKAHETYVEMMNNNKIAPTPREEMPKAMCLSVEIKGETPRVAYFSDPSGKVYSDVAEMRTLPYLCDADAYIFLVDADCLGQGNFEDTVDLLNRLVNFHCEHMGLAPDGKIDRKLAMVLHKADKVAKEDFQGYENFSVETWKTHSNNPESSVRNKAIQEALSNAKGEILVAIARHRFANSSFFVSSRLGISETTYGQAPADTAIRWLLGI